MTPPAHTTPGDTMRQLITGTVAGLVIGSAGFTAAQAADPSTPNLRCETADSCVLVIDVLYSEVRRLDGLAGDLDRIVDRKDRRIKRLENRLDRLHGRR